MRHSLCSALIALFAAVVCGDAPAHVSWSHAPGFGIAGDAGAVIGDLDADGRAEAIVSTPLAPGLSSALAVFGGDGDAIVQEQLLVVDGQLRTDIVLFEHPEGARVLALVQRDDAQQAYSLAEFAGKPLREIRRVPLAHYARPLAVADIDADGDLDLLAVIGQYPSDGTQVAILDYATLDMLWTDTTHATSAVATQLDADAALEIVIAGAPGRVVDGATRLPEWSYPAGFGELLFVGEFDTTVAGSEFAALPRDAAFPLLTIFRDTPLSPLREVAVDGYVPRAVTAHDLDGDGADEIVFLTDVHASTPAVLTPATGALRTLPQSEFRTILTAAGDMLGDATAELLLLDGDGYYSTVDMLRVVDSETGATRFSMQRTFGPYTAVAAADLDDDGHEEVVHAVQRIVHTQPSHTHCVLDGNTGRERACGRSEAGWIEATPITGRFNTSPGMDVVFLGNNGLVALDGATSAQLWRRQDISSYSYPFADTATLRFNDDAIDDLALLSSTAKIRVLDGSDGSTLWESVSLASGWGPQPRLVAADIDDDASTELLVGTGNDLYAFDTGTGLLEWSHVGTTPIAHLVVWADNGECRIGLYSGDGNFRTLRCDDRSPAEADRVLPPDAMLVRALPPDGAQLLLAAQGRLMTVDRDGATRVWTGFLGNALGLDDAATVITRSPRHHDVFIGSDAFVTRVRVDFDLIFADAFD